MKFMIGDALIPVHLECQGSALFSTLGQVVLSLSCRTAWQGLIPATDAGLSLGDVPQDLSIDGLACMTLRLCGGTTSNRLVLTSDLTLGFSDVGDRVTMEDTIRGRRVLIGVAIRVLFV